VELTVNEDKMKEILKDIMIEMIRGKREIFHEIIVEAIEEVGLANAIKEGRKNKFVSEDILEGQSMQILFEESFEKDLKRNRDQKQSERNY